MAALNTKKTPLQLATEALQASRGDLNNSLLASGSVRDALARAANESDPLLGQLRGAQADTQKKLGTVFADSMDLNGITDPRAREALREKRSSEYGAESGRLGGLISDAQGSQAKTVDKLGSIFDALTRAKEFDVNSKQGDVASATNEANRASDQAFQGRFDDLTRREKEAAINASNRSNRNGPGNLTFQDQVKNPLLAFLATGGKRVQDQKGGFNFFDKAGKPITVEQAAGMTPGGTKTDFLGDSNNAQDAAYSGKPLSAAANAQKTSAESGLQSLSQIDDLVKNGITPGEIAASHLPYGLGRQASQTYQTAARNVSDVLARLRTGAQINAEEERLYKSFLPGAGDTPATQQQKLGSLRYIFQKLASGGKPTAQELQGGAPPAADTSGGGIPGI